ncbi:MAG: hypothetical protein Ct9H90mP15_00020 [Candidatus Neomarinimicrobiota bacterium]|nr:MAG: hypothetical protein Ct9H90mP15_00020 [Candidatus Neomarinimicrobiota bacterium]
MNTLNDLGIACYSGSCSEIYKEKAFDKLFDNNQRPDFLMLVNLAKPH